MECERERRPQFSLRAGLLAIACVAGVLGVMRLLPGRLLTFLALMSAPLISVVVASLWWKAERSLAAVIDWLVEDSSSCSDDHRATTPDP